MRAPSQPSQWHCEGLESQMALRGLLGGS
jgi:hypothetical protein